MKAAVSGTGPASIPEYKVSLLSTVILTVPDCLTVDDDLGAEAVSDAGAGCGAVSSQADAGQLPLPVHVEGDGVHHAAPDEAAGRGEAGHGGQSVASLVSSGPEQVESSLLTQAGQANLLVLGERGLVLTGRPGPGAGHGDHPPPRPAGSGVKTVLQLQLEFSLNILDTQLLVSRSGWAVSAHLVCGVDGAE